jgi:hypothetical protein
MDMDKIWQAHIPAAEGLPDIDRISSFRATNNYAPLKKMQKMLLTNMLWAILIVCVYIGILCFVRQWQIQALIGITLAVTLWSVISAWQLRQAVVTDVLPNNLLTELKRNRDAIQRWMRVQIRAAMCLYPFSTAGGFLLGGVIGSGKSVGTLLSKPLVVWLMVIVVALLTPLSYYLGKWMCKQSFGKLLDQINETITELENI